MKFICKSVLNNLNLMWTKKMRVQSFIVNNSDVQLLADSYIFYKQEL